MPLEQLDGSQFEATSEAFAFAFTDYEDLELMLRKSNKILSRYAREDAMLKVIKNLLDGAQKEGWLEALMISALKERPNNPKLKELMPVLLLTSTGTPGQQLQKIVLPNNEIQDISKWSAQLDVVKRQVCRFQINLTNKGNEPGGLGSGFLIADDLILTNRHVVDAYLDYMKQGVVNSPAIQFDFMANADGTTNDGVSFPLENAPDNPLGSWLVGSSPMNVLDYALIRLPTGTGRPAIPTPAAYTFQTGDIYICVQHPDGEPMKIGVGTMAGVQDATPKEPPCVKYTTNTKGGSSGCPVFNLSWRPIALHRAGDVPGVPLNVGVPLKMVYDDAVAKGFWPAAAA